MLLFDQQKCTPCFSTAAYGGIWKFVRIRNLWKNEQSVLLQACCYWLKPFICKAVERIIWFMSEAILVHWDMAAYQYPKLETGRGWTLEPGNLEGDSGGDIRKCWGLRPQYSIIGPPRIPSQDSQVPLSTPGLYQAWNINTSPHVSGLELGCNWCRKYLIVAMVIWGFFQGTIRGHKGL